ncbi:MAG TPA: hypothetical protein PK516_07245 [Sedimentibacter sp.]|nr:hypothetical protein [Sedimentibacter sp.]NLA13847.1 hypothetical protein [Tissierellia bacterium]HPY57242.1 hypothetical protein [Sedimentibacter sp.]HQC70516.1 hypothetical protein [Sedimentibacter sp.]HQK54601.1 hypothetical protein [Sedimentibacter sp.]
MKKIIIFTLILAIALTAVIYAAPGDSNDPIVVLSYLNDRIKALISDYKLDEMENLQKKVDNLISSGGTGGSAALEVVEIYAGEKLIAGAGTELILRGGKAFVIGSEKGGISNVTIGKDFVSGMEFVANHLMIVPRDDGRGAYTNDYAIFMVRGTYEITK